MRKKGFAGKVNIVHYVTYQYMMFHKKRTFTTYAGIVFMVLLMTCVFVGKDTAVAFLKEAASVREGKWHYAVYEADGRIKEQIENLGYIKEMEQSAVLGMTEFAQTANEKRPYLNVKAYGEKCFDWYRVKLTEGRLPQNPHEIILSSACLTDGSGIQAGDTIEAEFFHRTITGLRKNTKEKTEKIVFPNYNFLEISPGQTVEAPEQFPYFEPNQDFRMNKEMTGKSEVYTVTGFMEIPVSEKQDGAGYTALTLLDANTLTDKDIRNLTMLIDFEHAPAVIAPQLEEIAGSEQVDANDYYMAFEGNSSDSTMNRMVTLMTVFFVVLTASASVILIYNVFQLSFQERCMYLGLLSSVGATAKQRRSSIYYEAFCLLFFAIPAGILAGFAVIYGGMVMLKPFLEKFISADGFLTENIPITLQISWKGLAAAVLASVLTVLLSVLLPAAKIGKIGAVESIRGNESRKRKNKTFPISRFACQKHGAEKMLAFASIRRQRRKNRSVCISLIVFMVILTVTAFGADTIHMILDKKTGNTYLMETNLKENEGIVSDLSHAEMSEEGGTQGNRLRFQEIKKELESSEKVLDIKEWYTGIWCGNIEYQDSFYSREYLDARMDIAKAFVGKQMTEKEITDSYFTNTSGSVCILAVDDAALNQIAQRCGADRSLLTDKTKTAVLIADVAELSTDNTRFEGGEPDRYLFYDIAHISELNQKETFSVSMYNNKTDEDEPQTFTVAGYADAEALKDYVLLSGEYTWLIMGKQTAQALAERLGYAQLSLMLAESLHITFAKDSEKLTEYLQSVSGVSFFRKSSADTAKTMGEAIAAAVDILLACFVALSSVICFLNLANSIGGRMSGRRKELAVLLSAGMTGRQMMRMLMIECFGIFVKAAAAAGGISAVFICGMRYVLSSLFGRLALQIPAGFMLLTAVAAAGAVTGFTVCAFRKEKEKNLLAWMREEAV